MPIDTVRIKSITPVAPLTDPQGGKVDEPNRVVVVAEFFDRANPSDFYTKFYDLMRDLQRDERSPSEWLRANLQARLTEDARSYRDAEEWNAELAGFAGREFSI